MYIGLLPSLLHDIVASDASMGQKFKDVVRYPNMWKQRHIRVNSFEVQYVHMTVRTVT
jgi:hypothetical protein